MNIITKRFVNGIAHITGGGFTKNIPRLLDENLSFEIVEYNIPELFKIIQRKSQLSWNEMFETFNCGIGLVIIIDKEIFNTSKFNMEKYTILQNICNDFELEIIGYIIKSKKPKFPKIN